MEPVFILAGALALCMVAAFLPWANAEAAIVGAVLLLPRWALPLLVLGAAAAQVIAKSAVYAAARRAPERMPTRARAVLARMRTLALRRRALVLTVLGSSTLGVPPFYLVALACGAAAAPLAVFVLAGFTGMLLRYAALAGAVLLAGGGR